MPAPEHVDVLVGHWRKVVETMDVGFSMAVVADDRMAERDIWRIAYALGFQLGSTGLFEWRGGGSSSPLVTMSPLEMPQFSLAQVEEATTHSGIGLGFNIPRNAAPMASFEACLECAEFFARRMPCGLLDEDMNPLNVEVVRQQLNLAIELLTNASVAPGSAEAFRLFGSA